MARPRTGSAVHRKGRWYARITLTREPKGADGRSPRLEHPVTREGQPVAGTARADEAYAKRYAHRLQERYDEGSWAPDVRVPAAPPPSAETTVASWCDDWLSKQTYPEAAKDRRRTVAALALTGPDGWTLGTLPVSKVDPQHIARWLDLVRGRKTARAKTAPAPRTVRNTLDPVARALRGAVFHRLLVQDPTAVLPSDIRPQAIDADPIARRDYRMPRAEVEVLLGEPSIEPRWMVTWFVLLLTGARVSEAVALRWCDLLDEEVPLLRRVSIARQIHHRTREVTALKTENCREVPEHPLLRVVLDWWAGDGWLAEYGIAPTPTDFLVPVRAGTGRRRGTRVGAGGPLWQQAVWDALQRDLEACGIKAHRIHDLRHTLASLCADAGMEENVAARWTHAPSSQTARHLYAVPSWERQCTEMRKLKLTPRRFRLPLPQGFG